MFLILALCVFKQNLVSSVSYHIFRRADNRNSYNDLSQVRRGSRDGKTVSGDGKVMPKENKICYAHAQLQTSNVNTMYYKLTKSKILYPIKKSLCVNATVSSSDGVPECLSFESSKVHVNKRAHVLNQTSVKSVYVV